MFFALEEHRRKMAKAREEDRQYGYKQGYQDGWQEGYRAGCRQDQSDERAVVRAILVGLDAAARINPEFLPALLEEYRAWYRIRAADGQA